MEPAGHPTPHSRSLPLEVAALRGREMGVRSAVCLQENEELAVARLAVSSLPQKHWPRHEPDPNLHSACSACCAQLPASTSDAFLLVLLPLFCSAPQLACLTPVSLCTLQ